MGFVDKFKELDGIDRVDAVASVFYSEERNLLTEIEYQELLMPDFELMRELYSNLGSRRIQWSTGANDPPWRCKMVGHYRTYDRALYSPYDIAGALEDSLDPERFDELSDGRPFSDDEWREFLDEQSAIDDGNGLAVVEFQTVDSQGRGILFVCEYGDWGTLISCDGPFATAFDSEKLFRSAPDTVFEGADSCYESFTPNWPGN